VDYRVLEMLISDLAKPALVGAGIMMASTIFVRGLVRRSGLADELSADVEKLRAELLAREPADSSDPEAAARERRTNLMTSLRARAQGHKSRATYAQFTIIGVGAAVAWMFVAVKYNGTNAGELWSMVSFRAGLVISAFFVMQILVSMFRYSLRLAAFYDARADALTLCDDGLTALDAMAKLFTPTDIDFGPAVRTPIGEMAAMLHSLKDSLKSEEKAKEKTKEKEDVNK
jgi:hypothetical protein